MKSLRIWWQKWRQLGGAFALAIALGIFIAWEDWARVCNPPEWKPTETCAVLRWLYDWQSLVAGSIAIVAALIGGHFIRNQILQADQHEKERVRRKHAAARAMLPLSLSAICEYAEDCGRLLDKIHLQCVDEALPDGVLEDPRFPKVPSPVTTELTNLVEFSDAICGSAIASLLSKIQVQASRLSSFRLRARDDVGETTHVIATSNVESYILDTVEICARAEALFGYARRETDEVSGDPPSEAQMYSALAVLGFHSHRFDRVRKDVPRRVEYLRRYARDPSAIE